MFVIKKTRVTVNCQGTHCFLVGYWNDKLQRFAAAPFATTFPADVANKIRDNLQRVFGRNVYDPAPPKFSVEEVSSDVKLVEAPADAPQFERD